MSCLLPLNHSVKSVEVKGRHYERKLFFTDVDAIAIKELLSAPIIMGTLNLQTGKQRKWTTRNTISGERGHQGTY